MTFSFLAIFKKNLDMSDGVYSITTLLDIQNELNVTEKKFPNGFPHTNPGTYWSFLSIVMFYHSVFCIFTIRIRVV